MSGGVLKGLAALHSTGAVRPLATCPSPSCGTPASNAPPGLAGRGGGAELRRREGGGDGRVPPPRVLLRAAGGVDRLKPVSRSPPNSRTGDVRVCRMARVEGTPVTHALARPLRASSVLLPCPWRLGGAEDGAVLCGFGFGAGAGHDIRGPMQCFGDASEDRGQTHGSSGGRHHRWSSAEGSWCDCRRVPSSGGRVADMFRPFGCRAGYFGPQHPGSMVHWWVGVSASFAFHCLLPLGRYALLKVHRACGCRFGIWYPPPPCLSYGLVQATAGVGTVLVAYLI